MRCATSECFLSVGKHLLTHRYVLSATSLMGGSRVSGSISEPVEQKKQVYSVGDLCRAGICDIGLLPAHWSFTGDGGHCSGWLLWPGFRGWQGSVSASLEDVSAN